MNILIVGKFHTESFARHIAETLEDMSHTVLRFEPGAKARHITNDNFIFLKKMRNSFEGLVASTKFVRKKQLEELNELLNTKTDLTIVTHDFLYPDQVNQIKETTKAPIVLWHPDSISNLGKYFFLNANYDRIFFKDPYIVDAFNKDINLNSYYLPECCNPKYHKEILPTPDEKQKFSCDITTAGNIYPNREAFFRNLTSYNIKIWGPSAPLWMDTQKINYMIMNEMVLNENKSKAFTSAKIVLNNLHPAEIWGVNCRTFEIPACGSFQIINFRPALYQLFEINKEIISFKNYSELIDFLKYYLTNDTERETIAKAGQARALKDHTYQNRLALLIESVFDSKKGFNLPKFTFN